MSATIRQNEGLALQLKGLKKAFGSKEVLRGVDLEINASEFVAVVGKSGCGKSTLVRLISGLDQQNEGSISLQDETLSGVDSRIRVVFQDHRLLPWKRIIDNVAFGLGREWLSKAQALLDHVGLGDRAQDWPSALSGGERQRVSLVRALLTHPGLLLFDEPLGALDALTRISMQELIETLWLEQRFTALLITHDVDEAVALADRVVVVKDGKIDFELPIDLPRPRPRGSREFSRLRELLLERVLQNGGETPVVKSQQKAASSILSYPLNPGFVAEPAVSR